MKITRCSILIQFILIFLNISVLLSATGTSSSGASSSTKSEVDGRNLAEKIQSEISEKLNSAFKEQRIFGILAYVRNLHSEFQHLNLGSDKGKNRKEKKKRKLVQEQCNKIVAIIDQTCTKMVWTKEFVLKNELAYLLHISKMEQSLREELAQLDVLIKGTEPIPKGITAPDALASSMGNVRDGSLQLIQRLSTELWFLLPEAEFTKLGESIEQDNSALGTAIQSLVDSSGRRAEIYATGIPSIIQNTKNELQAEYNRETSKIVKFIKDGNKILVLQLEEQMSNDRPFYKVAIEKITPNMESLYDKEETQTELARAELGKFVKKFNKAVDGIPVKISEKLVEKEDEDEYACLRLLDQLKNGTQELYGQMKSLMKYQVGTQVLEKNVGILRIFAKQWMEKNLHDLAARDPFLFGSIQAEIQEKGIDLSKPEVFSAAVTGRDLKQRVILGAIFCMAIHKRLDTLFQKAFPNGNSANKKDAENVLKAMEAGGRSLLIGNKLYGKYIDFMDNGDLYKFKVLVKLENLQKEFKEKLEKLQEEAAASDAKRMDPRLSECSEFLSKIENLDQQLWKWALVQRINENEIKLSENKVELENLYFIGAELAKLKTVPAKMLMMQNEAALFGESESTIEPLPDSLYTLHERTNQLMDQLSLEIWLLLPADEFAQLGTGIEQDKSGIRASIETLVSTADRIAQISAKVIPELKEREKSKIAELLNDARARLASDPWEERQSFFKMLNDHSKSLSKVDLKLVSSSQLYSARLFNDNMDRIHSELSRQVKKEDRNEYKTLRAYEQLSVLNRKFYEYMVAAMNSPPGSPELEDNLEKLWILAGRVKVSLEIRSRHIPPLQMLELEGKKYTNLVNFVSVQRTMPRSLLLTAIAEREDLLDRIVLRAMHLLYMFTHRFSRIFAGHAQGLWSFENSKSNQEMQGMVDAELVPAQIGEKLLYRRRCKTNKKLWDRSLGKLRNQEKTEMSPGDYKWKESIFLYYTLFYNYTTICIFYSYALFYGKMETRYC